MSLRDRIWTTIDHAGVQKQASLRDALYRLLVAIEAKQAVAMSRVDRSLDLAEDAIREGNAVGVMRARLAIDEIVATLAVGAPRSRGAG